MLPTSWEYETEAWHGLHVKFKVLQNRSMLKYSLKSILNQEKKSKDVSVF